MTRFRDQWDEDSRLAQTARAREACNVAFAERVVTYRVLTRGRGLAPAAALRRVGVNGVRREVIARYEAAVQEMGSPAAYARAALALAYVTELNAAGAVAEAGA